MIFKLNITSEIMNWIKSRNFLTTLKPTYNKLFSTDVNRTDIVDKFNRKHNYLRISLTERCNFRCLYCMPEEGVNLTPKSALLSTDEVCRLAELFVNRFKVNKIRLTGGEPLVRNDLVGIIQRLSELKKTGLQTIAITTNGLVFARKCVALKEAGLDAVNVSLDTLVASKFEFITRRKGYDKVIAGIEKAMNTDFKIPVKVNCVVMRDFNDDEINDFVELTRNKKIDVRFIEYMPFDGNKWNLKKMVTYKEMLNIIMSKYPEFSPIKESQNPTSKPYKVPGFDGQIGFITSMTENFCSSCNRIRITADGNLKVCLFDKNEVSLKDAMRSGYDDQQLAQLILDTFLKKKKQHGGSLAISKSSNRPMILIARMFSTLSHIDERTGRAKMVDVSGKKVTLRTAIAKATVILGEEVFDLVRRNQMKKGDVITVAQIAGIMGAKQTPNLIPLCHQISLANIEVNIELIDETFEAEITATSTTLATTGVEMESLVAVSIASLTIYDMCKSVNKSIIIKDIKLVHKSGGKSS